MPKLEAYRGIYLWRYVPNLPAAVVFTVLFAVATSAHTWKMAKTKMWFCLPFVVGGIFEVIGYMTRAISTYSTGSLGPYLVQAIFILLPPVLFAASLYMVYSRVVRAVHGEPFSLIAPRWTTVIFVAGDYLCLNIQSNGGGLLAKPHLVQIGDDIIIAGLILQVLVFLAFVVCCVEFHKRFHAHVVKTNATVEVPWQACLKMLYGTSFLILLRNIYRVVEFCMGNDAYLTVHEWPTYAFDAALMFIVMVSFFVWYPNQLQPSANRDSVIELTADGTQTAERGICVTESQRPLWAFGVTGYLFRHFRHV